MSSKNKFGIEPLDADLTKPRERSVGPMGAAVRDAAESLTESTEAKVEQRRKNVADAKAYRAATIEGRVLELVSLADIYTDDLPRDRLDLEAVAVSDEMAELKASIRNRGQKEPVELYVGADGRLQLKKGWRRLTALRQLFDETGESEFATVVARVAEAEDERLEHYIDMVEENVVREDLSFAEMAQVAIKAANDEGISDVSADALVGLLYGSLHKMKRSYIRSFVFLLTVLEGVLNWPKDIPRNLGVDVARALKGDQVDLDALRALLIKAGSAEVQNEILKSCLVSKPKRGSESKPAKQKLEFHVGSTKVTARQGEFRILSGQDYANIPKAQLEAAVRAFESALD